MKRYTYRGSGVDVERGDSFADYIKERLGKSDWIYREPAGYATVLKFTDPPIAVTADGIGTKLLLHAKYGRWKDAAEDLVAMNYNDLIAAGGVPKAFVDYLGVSRISGEHREFLKVLIDLLKELDMELAGGETAEMPDIYPQGIWDVAGFCVGIWVREFDVKSIRPGDLLIGLPSSGFHSNGWSLIRKILREENIDPDSLPFDLLKGTRIYSELKSYLEDRRIKALAHVTGGGIFRALSRIIPKGLGAKVKLVKRNFVEWILKFVDFEEAVRTFNMGWGMIVVASKKDGEALAEELSGRVIGSVTESGKFEIFMEGG